MEEEIFTLVANSPHGVSGSEISRKLGISRITVSKYLDLLKAQGRIVEHKVGPSKLWLLNERSSFIWTIKGRQKIHEYLERMFNSLEKSLEVIASGGPVLRTLNHSGLAVMNVFEKKIKLQLILHRGGPHHDLYDLMEKHAEMKYTSMVLPSIIIPDKKRAILVLTDFFDESKSMKQPESKTVNLRGSFVDFFSEIFDLLWNNPEVAKDDR